MFNVYIDYFCVMLCFKSFVFHYKKICSCTHSLCYVCCARVAEGDLDCCIARTVIATATPRTPQPDLSQNTVNTHISQIADDQERIADNEDIIIDVDDDRNEKALGDRLKVADHLELSNVDSLTVVKRIALTTSSSTKI
eukprot:UN06024